MSISKLEISLDRVLLDLRLVTTQCLFKKLGLGVGAREIAENPPIARFIL